MSAPDRAAVEYTLGHRLLDWQWNTLLGILGHLPNRPPHPLPVATPGHTQAQDAVTKTCTICGRVGTRRFVQDGTDWRCAPSATKCPGNRPQPAPVAPTENPVARAHKVVSQLVDAVADKVLTAPEPASDSCAKPEPAQVNDTAPSNESDHAKVTPTTPARIAKPRTTARCSDCGRTWTLTGRVLDHAIALHEKKRDHIVDILNLEHPANA